MQFYKEKVKTKLRSDQTEQIQPNCEITDVPFSLFTVSSYSSVKFRNLNRVRHFESVSSFLCYIMSFVFCLFCPLAGLQSIWMCPFCSVVFFNLSKSCLTLLLIKPHFYRNIFVSVRSGKQIPPKVFFSSNHVVHICCMQDTRCPYFTCDVCSLERRVREELSLIFAVSLTVSVFLWVWETGQRKGWAVCMSHCACACFVDMCVLLLLIKGCNALLTWCF